MLVNNAGIDSRPGGEDAGFAPTLEVNVTGSSTRRRSSARHVRGGRRVDRQHRLALRLGFAGSGFYDHLDPPFTKPPAYGASKAAVVNLTSYFARLWGPHGVRVNALSPGGVLGDQDPDFRRKFTDRVPLGRMAEPADLVGPMLFLASDASAYVTGTELRIDGGFTA